jgi:hypothetical protein
MERVRHNALNFRLCIVSPYRILNDAMLCD